MTSVDRQVRSTELPFAESASVGGWLAVVLVFAVWSSILLSFRELNRKFGRE